MKEFLYLLLSHDDSLSLSARINGGSIRKVDGVECMHTRPSRTGL
jgi:hypothetical protein